MLMDSISAWQKYYLGCYLTNHPMDRFVVPGVHSCADVISLDAGSSVSVGGIITNYRERDNSWGRTVLFTVDDGTATQPVVGYGQSGRQISVAVRTLAPLLIYGSLTDRGEMKATYATHLDRPRSLFYRVKSVLVRARSRSTIRQTAMKLWSTDPDGLVRHAVLSDIYNPDRGDKFIRAYCSEHGLPNPLSVKLSTGKRGWMHLESPDDNPLPFKDIEASMLLEIKDIRSTYSALRRKRKSAGNPLFMSEVLDDEEMMHIVLGRTGEHAMATTVGQLQESIVIRELLRIKESGR